ncbi:thyrostimulin beta-5 subunit-like [Centruroides vittatus]|uniref:thyrostimulin beta-5 subunit-like n=1 Tax=Centruroides vittatus TaxID=120091 RepID=UPI00350F2C95
MVIRGFFLTAMLATFVTTLSAVDPLSTLECRRTEYFYKATRTDERGRQCWDNLRVMSCWGRCDSIEIADWRFPYKKSYHPVCMHKEKILRRIKLKHCDPDAGPELRKYQYYEAITCSCQFCESSTASCGNVIPYRNGRR